MESIHRVSGNGKSTTARSNEAGCCYPIHYGKNNRTGRHPMRLYVVDLVLTRQ